MSSTALAAAASAAPTPPPGSAHRLIDTHVHLFPASELETLAWHRADGPLAAQHSVDEYRAATRSHGPSVRGIVFVEADRVSSAPPPLTSAHEVSDETGWAAPLDEVSFVARVAAGRPRLGEGHGPEDAGLCVAVVPWAPVPSGAAAVARYVERVAERMGHPQPVARVVGFRYLVQDKPRGTMLGDGFVDAVAWLAEQGYVFELGLDFRCGGAWQLEEAHEMLSRVRDRIGHGKGAGFVINHMAKPDMTQEAPTSPEEQSSFGTWRSLMAKLAADFDNLYVKLSGGLSEMEPLPPAEKLSGMEPRELEKLLNRTAEHVAPWVEATIGSWGPRRCMFASDWPVCNLGGGGNKTAWHNWWWIVNKIIGKLTTRDVDAVWYGNAVRIYQIEKPSLRNVRNTELET